MLSVNNQSPSAGTNVTSSMGVRRPSDGNVQSIINNMNDPMSNNGQAKTSSTSPTLTENSSSNGHFSIIEPRSRSSSASSLQSSGSYLPQTDLPGVCSQLELWSKSSQQNAISTKIDTDFSTNEATFSARRHSPPSPVSANADGSNVSSPTSSVAASLTRRDHITGHTHDRSRSASFDGEIEPTAWTLDRVLEWLDDNSFSEYKAMFIENNLYGEKFFALGNVKKFKNIVESGDSNRYKLITAIRKIGDVRPKRQSFSNKGNQSDVQSTHSGNQLSSSNLITEQNSPTTPTMQSVPSPTEQISKQKSLKLSTSFPELRSVNLKAPVTSPIIGPRTSSIGWEKSNNSNIISSTIKEVDSSNENTTTHPVNNNDKWSKSSGTIIPMPQLHNNNSSVIHQPNVLSPSEDIITSPLSPSSNRRIKGGSSNSSLKIASTSNVETKPDNGEAEFFVGLPKSIQVTLDNKNFRVVDLSGREDSSTIKDVIFSQLEIIQDGREHFTFHLTEIGQKEPGPIIDVDTLIQKCKEADDRGTLKLLIKRPDPYYGQSNNQSKMIIQGYFDSGKSSPPSNLTFVGDQSNKTVSRRPTPPEVSPPHFSQESNHSLPFNNNNEERRYNNFIGGFIPLISERWKDLNPLSEESQDTNKFGEKEVTFPVPHYDSSQQSQMYSSDHKTSYRIPNSPCPKNSRRLSSENNYSVLSPQNHISGIDYSRNNTSLKLRSQSISSSKHPSALQPANGMNMRNKTSNSETNYTRRSPSQESTDDNNILNPPPPPIPPKPNSVSQKSLISGGVYINPQHKYNSKSQPHLPLSQKLSSSTINSSEPDLTLWRPEFNLHPTVQTSVNAMFSEEGDEPTLWPKITLSSQSKKEEESFWAEEPKPSVQNTSSSFDDENSFWAEVPKSIKNRNSPSEESSWKAPPNPSQNDNDEELFTHISSVTNSIEPLRISEDNDNTQRHSKPKSSSYTSVDSGGDDDFWAKKPISSKLKALSIEDKNKEAADEDFRQKLSSNSGQSTNSTNSDENVDQPINSINKLNNDNSNDNQDKKRPNLARTVSLRRGVTESWVVRPTAEDLFEQLEQYFPGHDLDKPIVDANGSSVQQPNVNEELQGAPTVPGKTGGKIQRGKSIRAAAREAHEREQREKKERSKRVAGVFNTILAKQKLSRKPTTKLWDKKIVYVPSHKKPSSSDVSSGECVPAERKPVIWVKGELIGKGTFGKVFLAMNVNSSEIMAVKQIELPMTKSDRLNERQQNLVKSFTDEMEILKDLDHEHIVQYIGFERNEETINIFLEYVNGGSIGTCLRIYGAFKESVIRSFTRQILLGLQYLHNKGILHRDIKADNILVNEEGCCKISDFGISKKSDHAFAYDHNSNMSLQGTIFWMAPEVFTSTKGYSAKVDIWSLGCVVLEMFAGERPWNNLTDLAAMFKLGSEKKAPPIKEDIVMSFDAKNFLDQCFIIEPNDRPTAEQLLQHSFTQEDPNFNFKEYISIPGRT